MLGRLAFKNCIAQSQGIWVHVALSFQKFLRRGGEKFRLFTSHFFSLKSIILLLPKKKVRCLLEIEDSVLPGTSSAYKAYMFIQRNESIIVPRSLKAETSAGLMSRLLTEFSNVK